MTVQFGLVSSLILVRNDEKHNLSKINENVTKSKAGFQMILLNVLIGYSNSSISLGDLETNLSD